MSQKKDKGGTEELPDLWCFKASLYYNLRCKVSIADDDRNTILAKNVGGKDVEVKLARRLRGWQTVIEVHIWSYGDWWLYCSGMPVNDELVKFWELLASIASEQRQKYRETLCTKVEKLFQNP